MNYELNQRKSLFIIGGVIALLGIAIVVLVLARPPEEELSTVSQEPVTVDLTNHKIGELSSLTVENEEGGYTIKPTEPGVESYYVEELKDLPFNHDTVKYVVQGAFDPVITKEVGKVENLGEFGLDEPSATITLRFEDGSSVVCLLGDPAPSDEDTRYFCLQGAGYVYIASSDSHFLRSAACFAELNVAKAPDREDDQEEDQFGEIQLWGSSFPEKIVLKPLDGGYQMTEPIATACDDSMVNYVTVALKSVTALSAVAIFPDDKTLKEYGLLEPQAAVTYTVNGETFTLYASKKDDTTTYLMREGRQVVYEIPTEEVEMWTASSRYLLRDKSVISLTAADTSQVAIQSGDQSLFLALTREKDEDKSTESTDYYTYTVTSPNGQTVVYSRYSRLLEKLSELRLSADTGDAPPQGDPELSLRYCGFEDETEHILAFVRQDDSQLFVIIDGVPSGLIKETDFESIVQEVEKLMGSVS